MAGHITSRLRGTTLIEATAALVVFVLVAMLWTPLSRVLVVPLWQDEDILQLMAADRALNDLAAGGTVSVQASTSDYGTEELVLTTESGPGYRIGIEGHDVSSVWIVSNINGEGYMPLVDAVGRVAWTKLSDQRVAYHLTMVGRWWDWTRPLGKQPTQFSGVVMTHAPEG